VCKKSIKNSQPFGKKFQKTAGGIYFWLTLYTNMGWVTSGWLPQRAGSPGLNSGGTHKQHSNNIRQQLVYCRNNWQYLGPIYYTFLCNDKQQRNLTFNASWSVPECTGVGIARRVTLKLVSHQISTVAIKSFHETHTAMNTLQWFEIIKMPHFLIISK